MNYQKKYIVKISVENSAFDGAYRSYEVARILRELADKIQFSIPAEPINLNDINGNVVGVSGWAKS
jgi:hypothetical protein